MDKLRTGVTIILVGAFVLALVFDAVDSVLFGNHYEVPSALAGIVGTAVGGLYAPELLRRLKGDGNGHGADSGESGAKPREG
jgi:hypothetical protein